MPTWDTGEPDYKELQRRREIVRKRLLAKGLREGEGKWSEVFARHMRKHTGWN